MFRKIKNYYTYRNLIKQNLATLNSRYSLKFDPVYGRLWTVFNLPVENHEGQVLRALWRQQGSFIQNIRQNLNHPLCLLPLCAHLPNRNP